MPASGKNSRKIPLSASKNKGKALLKQEASDTNEKIVWDFSRLVMEGEFGFHRASFSTDENSLNLLFSFLHDYSRKTWGEIRDEKRPSKGGKRKSMHHEIPFDQIDSRNHDFLKEIQKHLGDLIDEYAGMYEFNAASKIRIWGLKSGARFFVVFFDGKHSAFPVSKSNT